MNGDRFRNSSPITLTRFASSWKIGKIILTPFLEVARRIYKSSKFLILAIWALS
jgi:hypothetical protein